MSAHTLKNPRWERFAQLMADGKLKPTEAYRKVTPKPGPGAGLMGHKWIKNDKIAARIAHIQAKALRKTEFDLNELLTFGVELIRLTPDQFTTKSPYAQVVISETGKGKSAKTTREYRMMDKGKMLALLAHVCGYTRPEVKETADQLANSGAHRGMHITINFPSFMAQERRLPPRLIELEPPAQETKKAKAAA